VSGIIKPAMGRDDVMLDDGWTVRPKALPPIPKRPELLPAPRRRGVDPAIVFACVAQAYGVTVTALLRRDRHRQIAEARGVACWLLRTVGGLSYPEIGRAIGRDHTTAMSAIRKALRRREDDLDYEGFTDEMAAAVRARGSAALEEAT
jgi:chromosomal replication initiator protein